MIDVYKRQDINIAHNPDDKESYFTNGNARGFNQLHLNAMYDLLDKIYTDIIIQPVSYTHLISP